MRGLAGWQSEVRVALGGKTEELERLAIELYARGLSMRDIEAAFTDQHGRSVLSRSAASRVAERLMADYQAFATRTLGELNVVYLFIGGVAERLHLGQPREAVLAAWGITSDGAKHLLALLPGTKEDTASCRDFLRDLKARGMVDSIAVITDGAPGLIRAAEDPAKPHHTRDGFRNRYPHAEKGSFWKWKMEQWREGKPEEMPAGGWGFTVLRPDVGFLKSNRSTDTLTWIGHSSFLLQLDGVNILTDPHLTKRASPVWRARIRTMALISHQTVPSFGPRAVAK